MDSKPPPADDSAADVRPCNTKHRPRTQSGRDGKGAEIAAHGAIGNLRSVALVSSTGTIDYLCHPRLDSPSVFCALLDTEKGGAFSIRPDDGESWFTRQVYIPDTNVLITRFMNGDAVCEITDFMPIMAENGPRSAVVRRIACIRGEASFAAHCAPRFDYDPKGFIDAAFDETIAYWQSWSAHSSYRGHWREYVMRSALVLKLLSSAEHGSIAAAATFGLPEQPGGSRNWDYRFCWIRDAAFTTFALMRLGYVGEAKRFNEWIADRADESKLGDFQILYRLDGSREAKEQILDHLGGYGGAKPVRIGNAAASQLQLDIYGALFDSGYLSDKYGDSVTYAVWERVSRTLNWLCENWEQPDEGIWEIRGERRNFLSSRLMCWVALDRGLRLVRKRSLPAENAEKWEENRTLIYRDIHANFWNEERGAFMQYKGGNTLDAAALLMPLMRFITAHDPRWLSTQDAIERELTSDVLVRRYETGSDDNVDGLDGVEGAFTPCCFWLVECLARSGKVRRARLHFEKLVSYANELGLFSEEIGLGGEQLGNTPQALTHLALISAAYTLDSVLGKTGGTADSWQQF